MIYANQDTEQNSQHVPLQAKYPKSWLDINQGLNAPQPIMPSITSLPLPFPKPILKQRVLNSIKNDEHFNSMEQKIHDLDKDLDPDFLIRWTKALDFDSYYSEWLILATSGKSDGNRMHVVCLTMLL